MSNNFFKNTGPYKLDQILALSEIPIKDKSALSNIDIGRFKITDIKDLVTAKNTELTFFHSKKYEDLASKTKALFCITTSNLSKILPSSCNAIIVDNVLISIAMITKIFYPSSVTDDFDSNMENIEKTPFNQDLKFGKNVLIGKNIKIGKNCSVGHNTIIESNVEIGNNCSIGSNVIIRNTIIKNDVHVLDSCVIGKKGFGFFPKQDKNIRYPHIGIVIINDNVEIGCGATIDRGSMSNTVIGANTYLDNQIHIAHNNVIGNNCIIAGQVGFAGSSNLGNNVMIGGQAGISGHLKIGNNVQIAGGSGVVKDIPNNSRVMGYPAKNLKEFIKENR